MKHDLKIWPQYFYHVANGTNTFELRENDRGFQPGDLVVLREWDPATQTEDDPLGSYEVPKGYTGNFVTFKVGYVLPIDATRVVFSLLKEKP